jgi:hypothetical protein
MLSLFIALLLLLGVNAVFRASSQTIQAGQALNTAVRNARAVQPIFFNDLKNCAPDSPAFVISSSFVPQWLNAADATANNATPGALPTPSTGFILSDHLHRADSLSFFARGLFKRKTSDTGSLISPISSDEAFIHYGHLRTLTNDGVTYLGPDDYAGIAEPYAANWVLGRNVILLQQDEVAVFSPKAVLQTNYYPMAPSSPQTDFSPQVPVAGEWLAGGFTPTGSSVTLYPGNLTPLGYGTNGGTGQPQLQTSRYDLASARMDQFRSMITNAAYAQAQQAAAANPYVFWWTPLVYQQGYSGLDTTVNSAFTSRLLLPVQPYPYTPLVSGVSFTLTAPYNTSTPRMATGGGNNQWFPRYRFLGSSIPSPNAIQASDVAGMAPFFQEHVSQFIVEYAGDFLSQDSYGNIIDTVPDGQIDWLYATRGDWQPTLNYYAGDFVIYNHTYYEATANNTNVTPPGSGTPPQWTPATPPKQIRWYGAPRDSTGSGYIYSSFALIDQMGRISKADGNDHYNAQGMVMAAELNNVVPLADLWRCCLNVNSSNPSRTVPYEVETGPTLVSPNTEAALQNVKDYAVGGALAGGVGNQAQARYTAVWRNDVPAMVRILMKVDDPNNAVQDGPWFEYVFKLK